MTTLDERALADNDDSDRFAGTQRDTLTSFINTSGELVAMTAERDALKAEILASFVRIPGFDPPKDEATCQGCAGHNPVWFAPSDEWNAVFGKDNPDVQFVCPVCFIEAAEKLGICPPAWRVSAETREHHAANGLAENADLRATLAKVAAIVADPHAALAVDDLRAALEPTNQPKGTKP